MNEIGSLRKQICFSVEGSSRTFPSAHNSTNINRLTCVNFPQNTESLL